MDQQQLIVLELRCPFCHRVHRSPYYDDLEQEVMGCRDRVQEWQKGRLETYEDPNIKPISVETAAYAEGYC